MRAPIDAAQQGKTAVIIWLFMTAVSTTVGVPAAGPTPAATFSEFSSTPRQSTVRFRLVQQPELEPPERLRRSGMIVETPLAPNAALGLGLFKVTAKRFGGIEARTDGRRQNSRKVGLNFHLQF